MRLEDVGRAGVVGATVRIAVRASVRRLLWRCSAAAVLLLWQTVVWSAAADAATGAAIYRRGLLPSGALLRGEREGGATVEGIASACMTCHRLSGLGSTEGRIVVPPIIGKYLFRPHSTNVHDMTLPHVAGYRATREPYTDASLARAIREGIAPNERALSYLMPRYTLDNSAMASVIAYLRELSSAPVPGVGDGVLHFATIVTPDADPTGRGAMLEVIEHFFADKNAFIRGGARPMQSTREIEYRVSRRWQLHVWELTGPPESWEQQLRTRLAAEPVFAVVSGIGGRTWAPVHRFCQSTGLPCLFPNVALPVVAEDEFYSVYFSRGVLLEADLISARLLEERAQKPVRRVVQIYRDDDVGKEAAHALTRGLAGAGISTDDRALRSTGGSSVDLPSALIGIGAEDAVILWLRPADLAALPAYVPKVGAIFVSGEMGGLEQAPFPVGWREAVRMTYPVDLPELRRVRMNFPLAWLRVHRIPVVAERIQADTYTACGILAETLTEMLDSFVRDYLVERVETMLSRRQLNGYYPRLSLAPGQRFASKGSYLVNWVGSIGTGVLPDGEWTVP